MSNTINGIALPASMVEGMRRMLEDLSRAPNKLAVAFKLGELCGVFQTLERLQRLSLANGGLLWAHASEVAYKREQELDAKEVASAVTDQPGV